MKATANKCSLHLYFIDYLTVCQQLFIFKQKKRQLRKSCRSFNEYVRRIYYLSEQLQQLQPSQPEPEALLAHSFAEGQPTHFTPLFLALIIYAAAPPIIKTSIMITAIFSNLFTLFYADCLLRLIFIFCLKLFV